jgi:hypothetical protein
MHRFLRDWVRKLKRRLSRPRKLKYFTQCNENRIKSNQRVANASNASAAGINGEKAGGYKPSDGVVVSYGKTGREDITPRFVLEGEEKGVYDESKGEYVKFTPKPQPWYIETENSDEYGDGVGGNLMKGKVTATFANGVLTIKGTGKMNGYGSEPRPWFAVKDQIVAVVVEAPLKNIGEGAFLGCINLKSVKLPVGLCEIGGPAHLNLVLPFSQLRYLKLFKKLIPRRLQIARQI